MPKISLRTKAAFILKKLQQFYPNPPIPLQHEDPFTLLIAVVLSAQCTDKTVNNVTPGLFEAANSPEKMAGLSQETILSLIKPCGLAPTKSKALKNLSKIIVEKHQGKVPGNFEALEALPGVGHKTASVVMCQAFKTPALPVDTHIHRLAYRWGLSNGKSVKKTEEDLKKMFPRETWIHAHLQMIYYGREYCPARNHKLEKCPICYEFGIRSRLK